MSHLSKDSISLYKSTHVDPRRKCDNVSVGTLPTCFPILPQINCPPQVWPTQIPNQYREVISMLSIRSLSVGVGLAASLIAASALEVSAAPKGQANRGKPAPVVISASAPCVNGGVSAFGLGRYTSCNGSNSGNDVGAQGGLSNLLETGIFGGITGWSLLEKVDGNNSGVGTGTKLNWTQTGNGAGSWQVASAINRSFVVSLKAGTRWSAYYFDNSAGQSITGGLWDTLGVSLAGNGVTGRDLSHAAIFVAPEPTNPVEIPEPGLILALGLTTLGGLGVLRRKQA